MIIYKMENFKESLQSIDTESPCSLNIKLNYLEHLYKINENQPEKIKTDIINFFFDIDSKFILQVLSKEWINKKSLAENYIKEITEYLEKYVKNNEMSFEEYNIHCYYLSGFISGLSKEEIDIRIDKQLKTMVKGVICPSGIWTPKHEIENQFYAKYIFQVSKSGFQTIDNLNKCTSYEINGKFVPIRIIGLACSEVVSYDGIYDCGSLEFLEHDFIHSGFVRVSYECDKELHFKKLNQIGTMHKHYNEELKNNKLLLTQVKLAFFMFTHELTTSIFVTGWPLKLPRKHLTIGLKYSSKPQILLKYATKIKYVPSIFKNEVEHEYELIKYLKLEKEDNLNEDKKIDLILKHLDKGYEYLNNTFTNYNESLYTRILTFKKYLQYHQIL